MRKLVNLKCTNCNADLELEPGREFYFCQYCGAKLIMDNDNEHIYRHIDEAAVKRAETEHLVKEKEAEEDKLVNKVALIVFVVLGILSVIFFVIGSLSKENDAFLGIAMFMFIGAGGLFYWRFVYNKNKK